MHNNAGVERVRESRGNISVSTALLASQFSHRISARAHLSFLQGWRHPSKPPVFVREATHRPSVHVQARRPIPQRIPLPRFLCPSSMPLPTSIASAGFLPSDPRCRHRSGGGLRAGKGLTGRVGWGTWAREFGQRNEFGWSLAFAAARKRDASSTLGRECRRMAPGRCQGHQRRARGPGLQPHVGRVPSRGVVIGGPPSQTPSLPRESADERFGLRCVGRFHLGPVPMEGLSCSQGDAAQ